MFQEKSFQFKFLQQSRKGVCDDENGNHVPYLPAYEWSRHVSSCCCLGVVCMQGVFLTVHHLQVIKSSGVSYKEETYHSGCFVCGACAKELAGEQFVTHDKTPYCIDCHTSKFAKKCLKCNQPISGTLFKDIHSVKSLFVT